MFFKPTTVASMVAPMRNPYELYRDLHKDAFGFRKSEPEGLSPVERAVEVQRMIEWMNEGSRIDELRKEVARFDLSILIERTRRLEGFNPLEAFRAAIVHMVNEKHPTPQPYTFDYLAGDWDYTCWLLGLPYSDAKVLAEEHNRLQEEYA